MMSNNDSASMEPSTKRYKKMTEDDRRADLNYERTASDEELMNCEYVRKGNNITEDSDDDNIDSARSTPSEDLEAAREQRERKPNTIFFPTGASACNFDDFPESLFRLAGIGGESLLEDEMEFFKPQMARILNSSTSNSNVMNRMTRFIKLLGERVIDDKMNLIHDWRKEIRTFMASIENWTVTQMEYLEREENRLRKHIPIDDEDHAAKKDCILKMRDTEIDNLQCSLKELEEREREEARKTMTFVNDWINVILTAGNKGNQQS
ncbi:unnamed protein product [Dimorphilus gyrociliatus]|uniref:Uncharacterized protein n=1 Tax=Dimorphilus gyrociliatus TaxID=2664684 RepID=A0A7I8VR60_9ANNE|nr:unnamed protein product [Dimorphilus gyrociliatus]